MRSVLPLAVILLGISLALSRSEQLFPGREGPVSGADDALEILAAAKGALLPAGYLGTGPERIGEAIRIGDRTLILDPPRSGLRSALLTPGAALVSERCFGLASSLDEARAFHELVERARAGSLLVLASSGRIAPDLPQAGDWAAAAQGELVAALAALGARARPGQRASESWALIALCLEGGWVPLAEGYSEDSGVVLSYVLGQERESLAEQRGDFVQVRAGKEVEVFLEDELQHASRRDPGSLLLRDTTVGGRRLAGILQPPRSGTDGAPARPSSLAWSGVTLGEGSGFLAWVGLVDGSPERSDGVRFELTLGGEPLKTLAVLPEEPPQLFQVDLRPYAGREVELELRVDPGATSAGDLALWGRPVLVHGFERPPLEAWAESR